VRRHEETTGCTGRVSPRGAEHQDLQQVYGGSVPRPQAMRQWLGHTFIEITLDTYSHVMPSVLEEAAAKIDAGLRKALTR
jgi:hypothetical protein